MAVTSDLIKVHYDGDGSTVDFPTQFKFYENDHVRVIHTDASETDTAWTEGVHYELAGADADAGGTVTVKTSPTDYTPASGTHLTILREPANTQLTSLPLGGPLSPLTLERMVDLDVMMTQRHAEQTARALVFPETEQSPPSGDLPGPDQRAGKTLAFDANGGIVTVTNFGRWRGAWLTATAYVIGDAVTRSDTLDIYVALADFTSGSNEITDLTNAARWALAIQQPSAEFSSQTFSGDTMETDFTLSSEPASAAAAAVYVDGVRMIPVTDYTITGTLLAFASAPGSGTDNILVVWATVGASTIADASVTAAKLGTDAVETAKIKDLNVTTGKLVDDAVTLAKMEHGTQGDLLTYGASGVPARLAKGTALQVLRMNAGATAQEWSTFSGAFQTIDSGTFSGTGPFDVPFTAASWRSVTLKVTGIDIASANGTLTMNLTRNNFVGIVDGANTYRGYSRTGASNAAAEVTVAIDTTGALLHGGNLVADGNAVNGWLEITVEEPNSTGWVSVHWEGMLYIGTNITGHVLGAVMVRDDGEAAAVDGIRLTLSAGSLSANYRLTGLAE